MIVGIGVTIGHTNWQAFVYLKIQLFTTKHFIEQFHSIHCLRSQQNKTDTNQSITISARFAVLIISTNVPFDLLSTYPTIGGTFLGNWQGNVHIYNSGCIKIQTT